MAAVVTQTLEPIPVRKKSDKYKLTMAWTSHTDGTVSGFDTDDEKMAGMTFTEVLKGKELVFGEIIPGATTPTDEFDVTVVDDNSVDLFGGGFADCTSGSTTTAFPYNGTVYGSRIISSVLTPAITNAGNAKTGSIVLYFD